MFYSKTMFVKKGPLAKIWLAAHGQKVKLTKASIIQTSISDSVESIVNPTAGPLALRLSGHLLLGLVRIYQRKVRYLQEDANEALTKMKTVFKASAVDLPAESAVAASSAITLSDNLDAIEIEIPDITYEELLNNSISEAAEPIGRARAAPSADVSLIDASVDLDATEFGLGDAELPQDLEDIDFDRFITPDEPDLRKSIAPTPERARDFAGDVSVVPRDSIASMMDDYDVPHGDAGPDYEPVPGDEPMPEPEPAASAGASTPAATARAEPPAAAAAPTPKRKRVPTVREEATIEITKDTIRSWNEDTSEIVRQDVFQSVESVLKRPRTSAPGLVPPSESSRAPFGPATSLGPVAAQLASLFALAPSAGKAASAASSAVQPSEPAEPAEHPEPIDSGDLDGGMPVPDYDVPMPEEDPEMERLLEEERSKQELKGDASVVEPEPEPEVEPEPEEEGPPGPADHVFTAADSEKDLTEGRTSSGFSTRTKRFHDLLDHEFAKLPAHNDDELSLNALLQRSSRARVTAAGCFYEVLVLKSHDFIDVNQPRPYADIAISRGPRFDQPLPAAASASEPAE